MRKLFTFFNNQPGRPYDPDVTAFFYAATLFIMLMVITGLGF